MRHLLIAPYFLLLFVGLTVPSDGGHGLLSIKSLSFLATFFGTTIYLLLRNRLRLSQFKVLCFLSWALSFFALWALIGASYGDVPLGSTIDQFKIFWLTLSVIAISAYLILDGAVSFSAFLKTLIYTNFAFSCTKVGMVLLHLMGFINMWSIAERLGVRFMSMEIVGSIARFQFSTDILTPFMLFFFLQAGTYGIQWNRWLRYAYIPITTFSIFLSFSRYLMFAALLGAFLHWCTLRFSNALRYIPLFIAICVAGVAWIGTDTVYRIIERRLLSSDNYASDAARTSQINALIAEHEQYPVFGKGLGGYAREHIRDHQILHSYEVQWAAFLMQFGVVGIACMLIPICVVTWIILSYPWTRSKIALFLMFVIWLLSGFTNPFLISLASGIMYSAFLMAGWFLSKSFLPQRQ